MARVALTHVGARTILGAGLFSAIVLQRGGQPRFHALRADQRPTPNAQLSKQDTVGQPGALFSGPAQTLRAELRAGAQVDSETTDRYSRRVGEVRIKVRINNASDEAMVRRKKLAKSKVRSVEVDAVVDTGAVRSCIPETIMVKLGLMEQGRQVARYADGRTDTVIISEPATLYMLDRDVSENFLVVGDEVSIGQTALDATDLLVDCAGRRVTTNPDHPNAPVIRIR